MLILEYMKMSTLIVLYCWEAHLYFMYNEQRNIKEASKVLLLSVV